MNIFKEVKERITARQVAERYGLKVSRNGMACCPFHNDKHPSMKIEQNYYCFACGAKGDAVNYVAVLFGLSPFEAAKKINEDFSLDIPIGQTEVRRKQKSEIKKKRRLRQKKNGFNSSRRRLTDGLGGCRCTASVSPVDGILEGVLQAGIYGNRMASVIC